METHSWYISKSKIKFGLYHGSFIKFTAESNIYSNKVSCMNAPDLIVLECLNRFRVRWSCFMHWAGSFSKRLSHSSKPIPIRGCVSFFANPDFLIVNPDVTLDLRVWQS